MKTNRKTIQSAMDKRLSFLDELPSCRAAVQYPIAQEEEPVMKKKISLGLVFAIVMTMLAAAAIAAGLLWKLSPQAEAVQIADRALEEKYGPSKIFEVIGITALVTGLVNWFFFPNVALCGASGVVFAFILLISFANVRSGEIPVTVILVALIFLGEQVYDGIFIRDNVSNLSHVLGGFVGAVAGYNLNLRR